MRMVEIILAKIGTATVAAIGGSSSTAIDFLTLFFNLGIFINSLSYKSGDSTQENESLKQIPIHICRQVELILTSTEVACFRPACLALALFHKYCMDPVESGVIEYGFPLSSIDVMRLAALCSVSLGVFNNIY